MGGTGKTPVCIALVKELSARGFNPGILTRGYKSHCKSVPCQVPLAGEPSIYGDEPCLMRRETRAPVVIDPDRARGADYLAGLGVDVIIADDGLQHYALDRDVEICVLDGSRMLGNGHLLPAGPLREAKWRLKTVDSIVVSGAVAHLGYFPMRLKQTSLSPLNLNSHEVLEPRSKICALAGIGNPDRFFKTLEDCGFVVTQKVEVGDHGRISLERLKKLADTMPVVMTAKDAIKYQNEVTQENLGNIFVLNVAASLSKQFYDDVVNKIKQSNYKVAQRRKQREAKGYVLEKVEAVDQVEPEVLAAMAAAAAPRAEDMADTGRTLGSGSQGHNMGRSQEHSRSKSSNRDESAAVGGAASAAADVNKIEAPGTAAADGGSVASLMSVVPVDSSDPLSREEAAVAGQLSGVLPAVTTDKMEQGDSSLLKQVTSNLKADTDLTEDAVTAVLPEVSELKAKLEAANNSDHAVEAESNIETENISGHEAVSADTDKTVDAAETDRKQNQERSLEPEPEPEQDGAGSIRGKSLKKGRRERAVAEDNGHDIFALKKQRSYDPDALPRELKRKRKSTSSGNAGQQS